MLVLAKAGTATVHNTTSLVLFDSHGKRREEGGERGEGGREGGREGREGREGGGRCSHVL